MAHISPVEIQENLKGMNYPADKEDLIRHAQKHKAEKQVIEALRELPDQTFNGPAEVNKAIGKTDHQSRGGGR